MQNTQDEQIAALDSILHWQYLCLGAFSLTAIGNFFVIYYLITNIFSKALVIYVLGFISFLLGVAFQKQARKEMAAYDRAYK